jgi:hypothetical protein
MAALKWVAKLLLAVFCFMAIFALSANLVKGHLPVNVTSQAGLVPGSTGFLLASALCTLVIVLLVNNARYVGVRYAFILGLAYYCAVTFVMQLETWYFLSALTVGPQLLVRLFLMGLPIAFIFIPMASYLFGNRQRKEVLQIFPSMPLREILWKFAIAALCYVVIYFLAGYYIAWQNPELRAFYGQPGDAKPFLTHMSQVLKQDSTLVPFQILRSALWVLCALPIIASAKRTRWVTAIVVGSLFSVPQNIWHIIENPLMPLASVRLSHLIETAPSSFLFGVIVVWLFDQRGRNAKRH